MSDVSSGSLAAFFSFFSAGLVFSVGLPVGLPAGLTFASAACFAIEAMSSGVKVTPSGVIPANTDL